MHHPDGSVSYLGGICVMCAELVLLANRKVRSFIRFDKPGQNFLSCPFLFVITSALQGTSSSLSRQEAIIGDGSASG